MSLRDGNNLSTWEGGLFDRDNSDSVSLLYRLLWIFTQWRGATPSGLELNEAGRPLGVASDIDVGRRGAASSGTASGLSTVYYQWGRYLRWLDTKGTSGTPSAANPNGVPSRHMVGTASDLGANDYARLDALAERVGMKRTISSEIWHYEEYRNPDPDIDFSPFTPVVDRVFGRVTIAAAANATSIGKDWLDMVSQEEFEASLQKFLLWAPYAENPHAPVNPANGLHMSLVSHLGTAITNSQEAGEWTTRDQTMQALHAIGTQLAGGDANVVNAINDAVTKLKSELEQIQRPVGAIDPTSPPAVV